MPRSASSTRATVRLEGRVPGEPRPVRADLRAGDERIGVLLGHLPVMRTWERADQDLLEVFAAQVGVALRNAELFATVEAQNAQLLELDAAKDDFLRGVSHNLQTPLTSIRAYADQLRTDGPRPAARDHRRAGRPALADGPPAPHRHPSRVGGPPTHRRGPLARVRGCARPGRRSPSRTSPSSSTTRATGWLAVGDADQLDQVLWALLDNAVKYGARRPVTVHIGLADDRLRLTIADHGPGRGRGGPRDGSSAGSSAGSAQNAEDGSGLGLYVARELARAMGGDLVLEPAAPDRGAAFSVWLPAEVPLEG